jgi:proteasome lid subunit RPN8/RPN11
LPALAAIRQHAADTYPHECCGALLAEGNEIVEAFALSNTTVEGAARRFLVGPADYRRAEARAQARGAGLAGFYHSHPDHPARPSLHDLDHAWPNFTYVIVSVVQGTPEEVTCWRLRDDRSGFDQGDLIWPTEF